MRSSTLSKATMGRLPLYLQFIRTVQTENVSSATVARALGLGEVQVRKDLASICPAGMPKIGYPTERLREDLEAVLGMKQTIPAVVIGAGKLGRALMAYDGFREYGLEIAAAFDTRVTDSSHERKPILPMEEMSGWCREHEVHIGILTVPAGAAQEAADQMVNSGITAILSFVSVPIRVPDTVTVKHENIALSLACLKIVAGMSNETTEEDSHGSEDL